MKMAISRRCLEGRGHGRGRAEYAGRRRRLVASSQTSLDWEIRERETEIDG